MNSVGEIFVAFSWLNPMFSSSNIRKFSHAKVANVRVFWPLTSLL